MDPATFPEIKLGDKIDHKRPTLVYFPHDMEMNRGARFVWGGVHYLVVERRGVRFVWLLPYTRWNRVLVFLGLR